MEEWIKTREIELAAEMEKAAQELQKHQNALAELTALIQRIQGAQAMLTEMKKEFYER